MTSLLLLAALSASAAPAASGVEELLARVEFEESLDPAQLKPIFPWDEANRRRVLELLRRTLEEMPIGASEFANVRKIIISNSDGACGSLNLQYYRELQEQGLNAIADGVLGLSCAAPGGWQVKTGEMLIAGDATLASVGEGERRRSAAAVVLVHELAHAWEDGHPGRLKPFYALRYEWLSRYWERLRREHQEWASRRSRERARGKLGGSDAEDRAAVRLIEETEYAAYGMPSRGGLSPRRRQDLDTHPMDRPGEYFAALIELLWADPERAREQYAPEEIAWAREHVFGGALSSLRDQRAPRALQSLLDGAAALAGPKFSLGPF